MDARRTETCVAPRHADASRESYFCFSERAAWGGGGGRYQTFSFSFFPCSADHERNWPPCKVVFRVGNHYAGCKKQQQQQEGVDALRFFFKQQQIPLYVCFIDLTKADDSVDRTLLWTVLSPVLACHEYDLGYSSIP